MKTGQRDFQALALSFYEAANQVLRADATAMLEHWSERDDVSYCDPNGQVHCGHEALVKYWQRAALLSSQQLGSVSATADLLTMQESNEMISFILKEHIQIKDQDQILRLTAFATNIYRHEDQQWRMVHRHAGTPSEEEKE